MDGPPPSESLWGCIPRTAHTPVLLAGPAPFHLLPKGHKGLAAVTQQLWQHLTWGLPQAGSEFCETTRKHKRMNPQRSRLHSLPGSAEGRVSCAPAGADSAAAGPDTLPVPLVRNQPVPIAILGAHTHHCCSTAPAEQPEKQDKSQTKFTLQELPDMTK